MKYQLQCIYSGIEGVKTVVLVECDNDEEFVAMIKKCNSKEFPWSLLPHEEGGRGGINLIPKARQDEDGCPWHGTKYAKRNKGRGSHEFYCSKRLDNGDWCGQKW